MYRPEVCSNVSTTRCKNIPFTVFGALCCINFTHNSSAQIMHLAKGFPKCARKTLQALKVIEVNVKYQMGCFYPVQLWVLCVWVKLGRNCIILTVSYSVCVFFLLFTGCSADKCCDQADDLWLRPRVRRGCPADGSAQDAHRPREHAGFHQCKQNQHDNREF